MNDLIYSLRINLPNFAEFYDDLGYYDKKCFDNLVADFATEQYDRGYENATCECVNKLI